MRALHTALIAVAVLGAAAANAQGMSGDMKGMAGKDRPAPGAKMGHGVGVITAINAKAETITIKHGAIPAVGWPAMTMTFKANPPALLYGRHVGERVGFDLMIQGMKAQVTSVRPL